MYAHIFMNIAFSHGYDRKEICNGELPGFFLECCIIFSKNANGIQVVNLEESV